MPILPKDKSLVNNSPLRGKIQDNSPSKDKLLSKEENSDDILFFPEEKTKNKTINSLIILSDIERKYLAFSEFIYNNPNGSGYCQISTEYTYPRIIITGQTDLSLIQNSMDYGFVDRIFLSPDCKEITNDTLRAQMCNLTKNNDYYAKFFNINP